MAKLRIEESDICCTVLQMVRNALQELYPPRVRSAHEEAEQDRVECRMSSMAVDLVRHILACGDPLECGDPGCPCCRAEVQS